MSVFPWKDENVRSVWSHEEDYSLITLMYDMSYFHTAFLLFEVWLELFSWHHPVVFCLATQWFHGTDWRINNHTFLLYVSCTLSYENKSQVVVNQHYMSIIHSMNKSNTGANDQLLAASIQNKLNQCWQDWPLKRLLVELWWGQCAWASFSCCMTLVTNVLMH